MRPGETVVNRVLTSECDSGSFHFRDGVRAVNKEVVGRRKAAASSERSFGARIVLEIGLRVNKKWRGLLFTP